MSILDIVMAGVGLAFTLLVFREFGRVTMAMKAIEDREAARAKIDATRDRLYSDKTTLDEV